MQYHLPATCLQSSTPIAVVSLASHSRMQRLCKFDISKLWSKKATNNKYVLLYFISEAPKEGITCRKSDSTLSSCMLHPHDMHMHTHMYVPVHTHMHTHTHTHTCGTVNCGQCMLTCPQIHTHTHTHAYTCTDTCTHTHAHAHARTHTHLWHSELHVALPTAHPHVPKQHIGELCTSIFVRVESDGIGSGSSLGSRERHHPHTASSGV